MELSIIGGRRPQPGDERPPIRQGDTVAAARAGLDVPRSMFVLWMLANRRIGRGDLVADRKDVRT